MLKWLDDKLKSHYEKLLIPLLQKKMERRFVLDTSTLIDGRVVFMFKHDGFDGLVVVNGFIVKFLKQMASSGKTVSVAKGKRGMLVIEELKKTLWKIGREVLEDNWTLNDNVEESLIEYCKKFNGVLVTLDAELTKVARAHHVRVINLHALMNDMQDTIFEGDKYTIKLVEFGKEEGQCIGYLKDHSMVVVDEAKRYIGKTVPVRVRNVVKLENGRLVFAKIDWEE